MTPHWDSPVGVFTEIVSTMIFVSYGAILIHNGLFLITDISVSPLS